MSPKRGRYAGWKRDVSPWVTRVDDARRAILLDTLARHDGNRTAAARELGVLRTYLQRLIREHLTANERRIHP